MTGETLTRLWDKYAQAGYENIYLVRIQRSHREKLGELFLSSNNGVFLDAGCGTGNMFELIVQKIQPLELHAVDWSEEMLKKAEREAARLRPNCKAVFQFSRSDISKSLDWHDNFFDGVVANLLICYLTCGWKKSVEELARVLKSGGYLYLGTLLNEWGFTSVLWKHAPKEFIQAPITSFRGLKYRPIISKISKASKKHGAVFPSRQELVEFLKTIGFEELEIIPTYWGGGLALRTKKIIGARGEK